MNAAFSASALADRLARFPDALGACVRMVAPADIQWKPAPEHWSILEICCHLLDEEREDFRARAQITLRDPTAAWPRLDLTGVAQLRGYASRDLAATLAEFRRERAASMEWLASAVPTMDWSTARIHPERGPLAAGMLLASWAAHDALHIRQIAKRLHGLAARDAGEYSIIYAGEW